MKFRIKRLDSGKYIAVTVPAGDKISSRPYNDASVCRWHAERAGYVFDGAACVGCAE